MSKYGLTIIVTCDEKKIDSLSVETRYYPVLLRLLRSVTSSLSLAAEKEGVRPVRVVEKEHPC